MFSRASAEQTPEQIQEIYRCLCNNIERYEDNVSRAFKNIENHWKLTGVRNKSWRREKSNLEDTHFAFNTCLKRMIAEKAKMERNFI